MAQTEPLRDTGDSGDADVSGDGTDRGAAHPPRVPRIHPAWWVAVVAFLTAIGAAGFRSTPGVLITPLHDEFGWPIGLIGLAVSVNLVLFGLTAPFSAALMERFGIKWVVATALALVSVGSLLPVWMTASWQLILCWGVLVGLGTGAMSMSLVAVVTDRWFVKNRGVVSGILTAAGATGQLAFLPCSRGWPRTTAGGRRPSRPPRARCWSCPSCSGAFTTTPATWGSRPTAPPPPNRSASSRGCPTTRPGWP